MHGLARKLQVEPGFLGNESTQRVRAMVSKQATLSLSNFQEHFSLLNCPAKVRVSGKGYRDLGSNPHCVRVPSSTEAVAPSLPDPTSQHLPCMWKGQGRRKTPI